MVMVMHLNRSGFTQHEKICPVTMHYVIITPRYTSSRLGEFPSEDMGVHIVFGNLNKDIGWG
jgi:hypothetical protein